MKTTPPTSTHELTPLLTVSQVAHILNVHPKTVYSFVETGCIPFVRVGKRRIRFRARDIDAWIDQRAGGR